MLSMSPTAPVMTSLAGALCTPSCVSQRAMTPATCPDGGHIDSTEPAESIEIHG